MPARVLGAQRHTNAHRDWCRAWLDTMNYTHSPCRADTRTHIQAYTHAHAKRGWGGLKGNVREKRAVMTLDFPVCLLQQRSLSRGQCRFHMQAYTQTHAASLVIISLSYEEKETEKRRKERERENKRGMCHHRDEKEKTSHPRNLLSPSLHPLSASLFPSSLSLIFFCFTFGFSFSAYATFSYISTHFLSGHQNVCPFVLCPFCLDCNANFLSFAQTVTVASGNVKFPHLLCFYSATFIIHTHKKKKIINQKPLQLYNHVYW